MVQYQINKISVPILKPFVQPKLKLDLKSEKIDDSAIIDDSGFVKKE